MKKINHNMKRVLVFGTFDLLHPGHLNMFEQAAALGEELFVVIALDETVQQVKNRKPHHNQDERLQAVSKLELVTKAQLGYPGDKFKVIEEIKPDIIALGYDQRSFTPELESELQKRGLKCEIIRLKPFEPETHKSSIYRNLVS